MDKAEQENRREQWRNRIKEWDESGLTQAEYCSRNDFKLSQFLYWRKKFSKKNPPHPAFVQLAVSPANRFYPFRIEIGSRFCVKVGNGYDREAFSGVHLTLTFKGY